jgi:O-glycosyl hydrolase
VLGIFGREDVFAAARWGTPDGQDFVNAAFDVFTSYDGAGGRFGDTSISATTSDNANTSVYASVDASSADRMVVVAINKTSKTLVAEVAVNHGTTLSQGKTYRMTASAGSLAAGPGYAPTSRNTFKIEMPATSVTTLVLSK